MAKQDYANTTIVTQLADSKAYFKLVDDFTKVEDSMSDNEYYIEYSLYKKALYAEATRQAKHWLDKNVKSVYVFCGAEFCLEELHIHIIIR
jgi:hypothetical protein